MVKESWESNGTQLLPNSVESRVPMFDSRATFISNRYLTLSHRPKRRGSALGPN